MILVTFAVPQESRAFTARLRHSAPAAGALLGNIGREEVAIAHTGMGAGAAREKTKPMLAALRPAWVIGSGFAGGLDPALEAGQLIVAENYTTPALLARVPAEIRRVRLHTASSPLDTPDDKARTRAATGADAVDLESSALATECAIAGVPLLVLRIVSDAAREPLPLPSGIAWDFDRQRPRRLAILRHGIEQPEAAARLARFTRRLPALQLALADVLTAVIAQHC